MTYHFHLLEGEALPYMYCLTSKPHEYRIKLL
jgi:hypothetical protein